MKKLIALLIALCLISSMGYAQALMKVLSQYDLCGVSACSTGGPNSTFTSGKHNSARVLTNLIDFTILDRGTGNLVPADRAFLEFSFTKADDDSLIVALYGVGVAGDTTANRLDSLKVQATANTSTIVELTPWINYFASGVAASVDGHSFPFQGKLSISNADSGTDFQWWYFGEIADTNIWKMRLVMTGKQGVKGP